LRLYGLASHEHSYVPLYYTCFIRSSDRSLTIGPNYSVIVWEALIESGGKSLGAIWRVWVSRWGSGGLNWLSLDHHGDGNVVVVRGVLGLRSVLLSDGLEGVITNNLSERLEGDGVNAIEGVGWGNLKGKSSLLINWDGDQLGVGSEDLSIGELRFRVGKGLHSVLKVLVGLGSLFNGSHGVGNEVNGGSVLESSSLSASKGGKSGEFHID